jgi:hypothetical protein
MSAMAMFRQPNDRMPSLSEIHPDAENDHGQTAYGTNHPRNNLEQSGTELETSEHHDDHHKPRKTDVSPAIDEPQSHESDFLIAAERVRLTNTAQSSGFPEESPVNE